MAAAPKSTLDYARTAQEQTLAAIKQSQAVAIDAVGAWAKAVEKSTAQLPALPVPEGLPTFEEIVAFNFEFAGEILAAQRQFVEKLVAAAAPAVKTKAA